MEENLSNQDLTLFRGDEVCQIDGKTKNYLGLNSNSFKHLYMLVAQLKSVIIRIVEIENIEIKSQLFDDGLECKVLRPGEQWQKGKIKVELNVKFYPDEPEEEKEEKESSHSANETENSGDNNPESLETEVSPLDDLRQKFNQENP